MTPKCPDFKFSFRCNNISFRDIKMSLQSCYMYNLEKIKCPSSRWPISFLHFSPDSLRVTLKCSTCVLLLFTMGWKILEGNLKKIGMENSSIFSTNDRHRMPNQGFIRQKSNILGPNWPAAAKIIKYLLRKHSQHTFCHCGYAICNP